MTPDLQSAVVEFLSLFLRPLRGQSGGGPLAPDELLRHAERLGSELEITVGEYRPYGGTVPMCSGVTVPADRAIHLSPALVSLEAGDGGRVEVRHEHPSMSMMPRTYVVRWLVERADLLYDDEATLRRVLRDLRPPATWRAEGEADDAAEDAGDSAAGNENETEDAPTLGDRVASAVAALEAREELPLSLDEIEAVPDGLDLTLEDYRAILARFFTFDESGDYYPKWFFSGATFPEDTTEGYRRRNVESPALQPGFVHVLGNVPAGFASGEGEAVPGRFREFVVRIVPAEEGGPLGFDVINSAVRTIAVDGAPARDIFDFCFFTVKA